MKVWWGLTIFWIAMFALLAGIVLIRNVDGAGVVQTSMMKLYTIEILIGFFAVIGICQAIAYHFLNKKVPNRSKYQNNTRKGVVF